MIQKNHQFFYITKLNTQTTVPMQPLNKIKSLILNKISRFKIDFFVLIHGSCAMPESDLKTQLLISKEGLFGLPCCLIGK